MLSCGILEVHNIDVRHCYTKDFSFEKAVISIAIENSMVLPELYMLGLLNIIPCIFHFLLSLIADFVNSKPCVLFSLADNFPFLLSSCICSNGAIESAYLYASHCLSVNDLFCKLAISCSIQKHLGMLRYIIKRVNVHARLHKLRYFLRIKSLKDRQACFSIPRSDGEALVIFNQNSIHTICWVNRNTTSPLARKKRMNGWILAYLGNKWQSNDVRQGFLSCNACAIAIKASTVPAIEDVCEGRKKPSVDSIHNAFCQDMRQTSTQYSTSFKKLPDENETGMVEKVLTERANSLKLLQPNFDPRDHRQRLSTFIGWRNTYVSAEDLAAGGFYVTKESNITCYSCHVIYLIDNFIAGDPSNEQWHQLSCRHMMEKRSGRGGGLASDGRISDDVTDPPGQQSIYIPPGDIWKEVYRLSTFENFPVTSLITRKTLAKFGFYFTGYHDRVKCFACARTVQQWVERDDPADAQWHKSACPLVKGEECGNIPLPSLFSALFPVTAPVSTATNSSTAASRPANTGEEVLEQCDPNTGAIVRRVRYPSDLPERIRQTGGTFEIGPNNEVIIQSGAGPSPRNPAHVGLASSMQQPRRQWRMANVVSADHKRFLTNLYLNRELDRLVSFARWPVGRPNIAPACLAKSGFFYLGDMDRTQCFSCGGVLRNWKLEDDADTEHRAHFPQCRMMLGIEDRNASVHEYPETEEDRERKYPCRFPSNPHMRNENSRVATFDQRWPMRRTAATPAEIAQAGFFFLGERDRVKCWYCNGGLQNWEYDDIPWAEHAKWFPNCQFLLRVKGQHFVYRHLVVNPHLARPIIARQDGSPLENVGQPGQNREAQTPGSQDVPPSGPRVNQPEATPIIIDPQVEMRRCKERVEDLMKNSDVVKFVISMGFDRTTVAAVLEERINTQGTASSNVIYESASDLLDDVSKKEEELKREEHERQNQAVTSSLSSTNVLGPTSPMTSITSGAAGMASLSLIPGYGKYNVSYNDDDDEEMDQDLYGSVEGASAATSLTPAKQLHEDQNDESLRKALEAINEEKLCKICFSNQADMVFIPCSHLCCCMECTQAITQCPICRKPIQKAIKTYSN